MPEYKRWFSEGGTYFFTIVTYGRKNVFDNPVARNNLRQAITEVQTTHPFEMQGVVLLPNHIHCIWKMTTDDDYSVRWKMIKTKFTKLWIAGGGIDQNVSLSRRKRGEHGIWQRRFWAHLIRNQKDFARHMDYIHYNPVKHGYVKCPHQWEYSSFHRWVENEIYEPDWMCQCYHVCKTPDFGDINDSVGE
ncbi:MAG: transposase [Sedimentisphaerales bacterium]|nr:transposase [Sedimentisphaerales bacterium]